MFNPLTVLIIDDCLADREWIEEGLQSSVGFLCKGVGSMKEGLAALKADRYDVILLDLRLPDINGEPLKAFFDIQNMQPDRTVPIIVVSGYDDDDLALQVIRGGAQDYFPKDSLLPDTKWLKRAILRSYMRNEYIKSLIERLDDCKPYNPSKGLELISRLKDQLQDIERQNEETQ